MGAMGYEPRRRFAGILASAASGLALATWALKKMPRHAKNNDSFSRFAPIALFLAFGHKIPSTAMILQSNDP